MSSVPQIVAEFCEVFYNGNPSKDTFYRNLIYDNKTKPVSFSLFGESDKGYKDGIDKHGYGKNGYKSGKDLNGFDVDGYDDKGYDKLGCNYLRYDHESRFKRNGYTSHEKVGSYAKGYCDGYTSCYRIGRGNGYDDRFCNGFCKGSKPELFNGVALDLLFYQFNRKLETIEDFASFKSTFGFIKIFADKNRCSTSKEVYHLVSGKYKTFDTIGNVNFSVPREFRKKPLRTKFSDIFIAVGKELGFSIVTEQDMFYEFSAIFHLEIPYYANLADISAITSKALTPFVNILFNGYVPPVENAFSSIASSIVQDYYVVINANKGCIPEVEEIVHKESNPISAIKIDNMSLYKRKVYKITYIPKPFNPKPTTIKKEITNSA